MPEATFSFDAAPNIPSYFRNENSRRLSKMILILGWSNYRRLKSTEKVDDGNTNLVPVIQGVQAVSALVTDILL